MAEGAPIDAVHRIEAAALTSWPAMDVEMIGRWRVRATRGFTRRANSVHTGGEHPGDDLDRRLERIGEFYASRDQPTLICLPLPYGELHASLERRGWSDVGGADVMIGVPVASGSDNSNIEVALSSLPSPEMLDVWWSVDERADQFRGTSSSLLHRIDGPIAFALARIAGQPVGCGLGTIRDGLLGLQCFATVPEVRGQGVATAIFDALVAWAAPTSEAVWLQVGIGNTVAKSLYESLGLRGAYRYAYLSPPAPATPV